MLTLLFLFATAGILYWLSTRHPKGFPDGPRLPLPIVGDGLLVGSNFIEGFERLRQKYGEVVGLYMGPFRSVIVSDYDLIQEVGSNPLFQSRQDISGSNGIRGDFVKTGNNEKCVGGLIASTGITWVEQRRFALHTLRDLGFGKKSMENMIAEEVQDLCKRLEKSNGQPINIRLDFNLAVINSLWAIATSERLDSDDPKIMQVVDMLDRFFQEVGNPVNFICFMYPSLLNLAEATNALVGPIATRKMFALFSSVVSDHENSFQEDNLRDFTDHYLKEIKEVSESSEGSSFKGIDGRANLVNCLLDFFTAGSETTSNTLNWAMLYMIIHPDVQSKMREELDEVTGRGRLPTLEDREETPYTEAFIHELQRCVNLVPTSVVHRASADALLGGKYFIPKGTDIYPNLGRVMSNPKYFPNPHIFDPTRHLTKEGKFQLNPLIIPFGVGRRRCLGEPLAKMSLYLFLTGIVSNFNLTKANESDQLTKDPICGITTSPKPYKLRFIPRK